MRDELERLEKELKRRAPKPKPEVRKQTLSKAVEAFDRTPPRIVGFSRVRQGRR